MAEFLWKSISPRNPFRVVSLPLIARLYRAAHRKRRRFAKRFIGKPMGKLFGFAYHRLGMGGMGRFALDLAGGAKTLEFDARNTQFHALYLPAYTKGYEPEATALLDLLIGQEDCFLDIGSNWGFYALFVASRPGFTGKVHAIEPFPSNFRDLSSLVAQAGLKGAITCHQIGMADRAGSGSMVIEDKLHSGIARFGTGKANGIEVPLVRLDDLAIDPPQVIKMDVEGYEGRVLEGARQFLADKRPLILFESWREVHDPAGTLHPFAVLREMGYVFFQPVWRRVIDGRAYTQEDMPAEGAIELALVPFIPEQRFLLASQINVFACPEERLDFLAQRFQAA